MSAVIEALMGNLFFVIIVIGIIASLFNKLKQAGSQEPRMPDFGGGAGQRHREEQPYPWDEQETPVPDQPMRRSEPARSSEPVRGNEAVYVPHEPMPDRRYTARDARPSADFASDSSVYRPLGTLQEPSDSHGGDPPLVTSDDLARAVLWAEILGPPRAKRPYRLKR